MIRSSRTKHKFRLDCPERNDAVGGFEVPVAIGIGINEAPLERALEAVRLIVPIRRVQIVELAQRRDQDLGEGPLVLAVRAVPCTGRVVPVLVLEALRSRRGGSLSASKKVLLSLLPFAPPVSAETQQKAE